MASYAGIVCCDSVAGRVAAGTVYLRAPVEPPRDDLTLPLPVDPTPLVGWGVNQPGLLQGAIVLSPRGGVQFERVCRPPQDSEAHPSASREEWVLFNVDRVH